MTCSTERRRRVDVRRAWRELELCELRAYRWVERPADGELADRRPGQALHGLLEDEVAEIVALYHECGEIDRSQRSSPTGVVPGAGVGVALVGAARSRCSRPLSPSPPRPARAVRQPFPDWVEYRPNAICIYDTTHFPRAGVAVTAVEDLVSRKWIGEIVSAEETSTQVQVLFTDALAAEGLLPLVEARQDRLVNPTVDDESRPIMLAMSDNVPQINSGSTREFMALCATDQHFGRLGTPTDQAWIESLFGHAKIENPHLLAIRDPAVLRDELALVRSHYNAVRLHAGIGYVTPNDEHDGRGKVIRKAREAGTEAARLRRLAYLGSNIHPNPNRDPAMLTD